MELQHPPDEVQCEGIGVRGEVRGECRRAFILPSQNVFKRWRSHMPITSSNDKMKIKTRLPTADSTNSSLCLGGHPTERISRDSRTDTSDDMCLPILDTMTSNWCCGLSPWKNASCLRSSANMQPTAQTSTGCTRVSAIEWAKEESEADVCLPCRSAGTRIVARGRGTICNITAEQEWTIRRHTDR